MSSLPVIRITIPVFNAADSIGETLESIAAQDYPAERVFTLVADFGSTDGTVEKILARSGQRLGLMQIPHQRGGRTAPASALKYEDRRNVPGLPLMLAQGDLLYPECLQKLTRFQERASRFVEKPLILADVDLKMSDGSIDKAHPLYDRACFFHAFTDDSIAFAERGYRKRVLAFGAGISAHGDKGNTFFNQRSWWNEIASFAMVGSVGYLPEALCLRQPCEAGYDPLDDILFRLDGVITLARMAEESPNIYVLGDQYGALAYRQLALYALWRAFQAAIRGETRMAEDCWLMAKVIDMGISQEPVYAQLEEFLKNPENESLRHELADFFDAPEPAAEPKWPMPSELTEGIKPRHIVEYLLYWLKRRFRRGKTSDLAQ